MADSTSPIDQIVVGQAQPAVLANELFDAMSPAAIYGRRGRSTSGLTWGYYGGRYGGSTIANGTIVLPASQASVYIVVNRGTGVVSQSTSNTNWNDTANYQRLYLATTSSTSITAWEDHREWVDSAAGINTEQVQDIVGALITAGSNVTVTYNDAASPPTIVIAATGGGGGLNSEQVEDVVGALIVAGAGISAVYDDASSPPTLTITATGSVVSPEQVQDIVGALIVAGSGISIAYDDAACPATLTITATGGGGGGGGSSDYSEGAGVPALGSPSPANGSRHFDTDAGILYTYSDYVGNWVEM